MTDLFDIASPQPEPETAPPSPAPVATAGSRLLDIHRPTRAGWAMAWAVCFAALAAVGLIATGSWTVFLGLILAALPGAVSAFWRPLGLGRIVVLAGWALLTTGAAVKLGGSSGPILVAVLGPALAGVALGAWRPGAVLATLALLATWLLTQVGGAAHPALGGFGTFLTVAAVGFIGASALHAAQVVRRGSADIGAKSRPAGLTVLTPMPVPTAPAHVPEPVHAPVPAHAGDAAAELAKFEAVMGDLPELAMLMDRQGRAEAVFGRPIEGVTPEALHVGLMFIVASQDRPAVQQALALAGGGERAEATFSLSAEPSRRLRLSVSPTQAGLAAILTEPPLAASTPLSAIVAAPAAVVVPVPVPDLKPELEAAQQALATAETERDAAKDESAAKSRFLANMSHELRTPLNAIIGFSDIMRTKLFGPLPERYGEYAEMIHESGQHLTDLINDVLDMSKLEADRYVLHRETFDAREPITSALKLMRLQADDKGVHLRGDLPSEPLKVDADRRAVKQIVLNLVSNALKFTPPEGRIDVTLRALDGALELVVSDTGVGIAAEDLDKLGTPYEQTDAGRRAQGTGLGLSLVKALTALHGGEFSLESRLGEGSAATVRLPVLIAAASAEEAPVEPAHPEAAAE